MPEHRPADNREGSSWWESDSRFIPAHWQPAALLDLLEIRDVEIERALSGTKIFRKDVAAGKLRISPRQFARLINNAMKLAPERELSFLYGQRLFPGQYGEFSTLLYSATNLYQAMAALCEFSLQLNPFWRTRLRLHAGSCVLTWEDSFGLAGDLPFMAEAFLGGWIAYCRWLGGSNIPWQIELPYAAPAYLEQYDVHLKVPVCFNQPAARLKVSVDHLFEPWPRGLATGYTVAENECRMRTTGTPTVGFLSAVRQTLRDTLFSPPTLPAVAAEFSMSCASLKRRLHAHGTSFQKLLDEERKLNALQMLTESAASSEEVARKLHFYDVNNFRRAFKRWTGLTPSEVKGS